MWPPREKTLHPVFSAIFAWPLQMLLAENFFKHFQKGTGVIIITPFQSTNHKAVIGDML